MSSPPPASPKQETLDFARAFRFVFDDPDWIKKVLMGSLFSLLAMLLVGVVFLAGYFSRLIVRTARGEAQPLPDWDDLGGLFSSGLRAVGAYSVYLLAIFLPLFGMGFVLVLMAGGLSASGNDVAARGFGALAGLGFFAAYGLFILAMFALMLYLPAAITRQALSERFGAAFEVQANFAFIRRNALNYFLALVFYLVASFAAQFGILACCVGLLPATFWSLCVFGFALGEVARLGPGLSD
jgi:hypothetical protein